MQISKGQERQPFADIFFCWISDCIQIYWYLNYCLWTHSPTVSVLLAIQASPTAPALYVCVCAQINWEINVLEHICFLFFHLFVYVCVGACMCHEGVCVEVRGQLEEVGSLLPICGSQGLNSAHQSYWQVPISLVIFCLFLFFEIGPGAF